MAPEEASSSGTLSMFTNEGLAACARPKGKQATPGTPAEGLPWFGLCLGNNTPTYLKGP